MENIHQIVCAIFNLYLKSEIVGSLPPSMVDNIGHFIGTLRKIYTFVEAQQDKNMFKQLFRNSELSTLHNDCRVGLDYALNVFKINTGVESLNNIDDLRSAANFMQEELLRLISVLPDASSISDGLSVYLGGDDLKNSSNSFSMLPSKPKIFHGRESEMEHIVKQLTQESPRIAILGGGGMGKTSLARAALHHQDASTRFQHRIFVSAEPANSSVELAALIGLNVGLNPGKDLTKPVVQYFLKQPLCLLILDNLETVWEPIQARDRVEEFLSLLTDVPTLALIITMRGSERPAKVHWTRPFLPPLEPLSDQAATQTFMDITDNSYDDDIGQLLQLTENMPLAVDLIAHLAEYEGCSNVLTRWTAEKTSLLSFGPDRKSNLDLSINLSLLSPRITADSMELLSLLSMLPDGLSDVELVQSNLPIHHILSCKSTLLATSLAYQDSRKRLRSLMPVREYVRQHHSPSGGLVHSIRNYFYLLLDLYEEYQNKGQSLQTIVNQITLNLANLQEVLQQGLYAGNPDITEIIYHTLTLNTFHRITGRGETVLMNSIPATFPKPCDHRLEASFLIEAMISTISYRYFPTFTPEQLMCQIREHFQHFSDQALEARFHSTLGGYFFLYHGAKHPLAMESFKQALELFKLCGNTTHQYSTSLDIAHIKLGLGDFHSAQVIATEMRRLFKFSGNLFYEGKALWTSGICSMFLGDYSASIAQLNMAKKHLDICGMNGGAVYGSIIHMQAEVHLRKSEYTESLCLGPTQHCRD
ncbi:hypothetical protein B0H14DRAFT_1059691 [Mycena olivaceomarginata]|nr:hypothetical protein B0H14DRAFT_1059691 [Mycena olivaceomarginata]